VRLVDLNSQVYLSSTHLSLLYIYILPYIKLLYMHTLLLITLYIYIHIITNHSWGFGVLGFWGFVEE
jgi:hypothetical protein